MKYIIADPELQSGIELKKILDGFEVLDFQGSFAAFDAAQNYFIEHPPDIAFIRLGKTEMNAFRLVGVIKKRNPNIKVIFIGSRRESAVEAFEYEADGFLLTPFNKKKIEMLLQKMYVND